VSSKPAAGHSQSWNTINNSNSINASGAIDSFFNGLRGLQN
jgi:hypothetical protein